MGKSKDKSVDKRKSGKIDKKDDNDRKRRMRSEVVDVSKQQVAETPKPKKKQKIDDTRRVLIQEQDENNNATIVGKNMKAAKIRSRSKSKDRHLADDVVVSVHPRRLSDEDDELLDYDDVRDSDVESEHPSDSDCEADSEVIVNFRSGREMEKSDKDLDENDPRVQRLLQKLVDKKIEKGELEMKKDSLPEKGTNNDVIRCSPMVKSPSDTTIYAPALGKSNQINKHSDAINSIVNFVEGIRLQQDEKRRRSETSQQEDPQPSTSSGATEKEIRDEKLREARDKASKAVLDAEQFKAMVDDPKGKNLPHEYYIGSRDNYGSSENYCSDGDRDGTEVRMRVNPDYAQWPQHHNRNVEINDDAFFHITCHIDPNLRGKIERGEYVDLEKLLPRNRFNRRSEGNENGSGLFRWITKNGNTYPTPVDRDGNISGVRKWEQAFRVYATIYSNKNPHRAAEIWQYIHVINTAASTFIWDNVAEYDFTFRQLMHSNPQRSWATTYTQMWNLTLREHINRNGSFGSYGSNNGNYRQNNNSNNGYGGGYGVSHNGSKKSDYCWKFQRNGSCPDGRECKWINRCKYCDGTNHGYNQCRKRKSFGSNNSHTQHSQNNSTGTTSQASASSSSSGNDVNKKV